MGLPLLLAAAGHPGRRPDHAAGERGRRARHGHPGRLRRRSRAVIQLSRFKLVGDSLDTRDRAEDPRGAGRPRHLLPRRRRHRLRRRRATSTCRPATTRTRSSPTATSRSTSGPTATPRSTPSAARRTPTTCAARCCGSRRSARGGYTDPPGNLFAPGTAGTRPEIYLMGLRNPFRIELDRGDQPAVRRRLLPRRRRGRTPTAGPPATGKWFVRHRAGQLRLAVLRDRRAPVRRLRLRDRDRPARRSTARRR